jgi:glucose/mannose-6-phosphate isomerase
VLDDLKFIHQKDQQDALGIAEKQWQQLEVNTELPELNSSYNNVVFAGMGGSALAASIAASWPGVKVPFEICRTYDIPKYVDKSTLFIASSYSGDTEETISAFEQAQKKTNNIVCITRGGKLAELAKKNNLPVASLPDSGQPRFAVLASLKAVTAVLERAGLAVETDATKKLEVAKVELEKAIQGWVPTVATKDNPAKKLALELMGKTPVVYAGPLLAPAAYKWKISFNENAKNIAWSGQLPEFNHNEFLGWSSHPVDKPYEIIDLRSNLEHKQVKKRFIITTKLLSGKRPTPHVIEAEGHYLINQLLWTITLGDFVSIYLALLNGLNPTPVDLITKLKESLNE